MSQRLVNTIVKEHKKFMWFAMDGALNRYDGHTFKVFKHQFNNANTVSNNLVYDIEEADTGLLKITTSSSIDKFDVKKEIFTHYRPGEDITVNDVFINNKNRTWLSTTNGLLLFNKRNNSFTYYAYQANSVNGISNNHVYQLVEDNNGFKWLTTRGGLNCFHPATQQFVVCKSNVAVSTGLQIPAGL